MYTCRTCKHLQSSKAKKEFSGPKPHSRFEACSVSGNTIIDCISDYYCKWMWFNSRPDGQTCHHWKYKNGKNWL